MATLNLLGTGAAYTDPHRTTAMLAVTNGTSTLAVDCGGDLVQRLLFAGIDLDSLSGLVITHEHADHVSGFPLFMEKIWLAGRRRPIPVYGIAPAISQARRCFETFDTSGWKDMPEIQWQEIPHEEQAEVLNDEHWRVTASPGNHAVPVIGLRIEEKRGGGVVTYSCDTEPVPEITCLAYEADILVHEANGEGSGHSSMEQAAEVATAANARRLLLIHLPPGEKHDRLRAARSIFPDTDLAEELGAYEF